MANDLGQLDNLCQHMEELRAVDIIEQLQEHENIQVYKMAQKIIDKFFGAEVSIETSATPLRKFKYSYMIYDLRAGAL